MKRKLLGFLLLFIFAFSAIGCTGVPIVTVSQPLASVDQEIDLTPYFVVPEKAEPNLVPIEPELQYVNTDYLIKLIKMNSTSSPTRNAYDEFPSEWGFVLIDSRPPAKYNEGHINGAINIPDAQFDAFAHLLPADKEKILIFYCGGLDCPLSPSSAKKAIELGYTNVMVYQEGIVTWQKAANYTVVTPAYLADLIVSTRVSEITEKPFIIVDSRPYETYFNAHIPGAVSMDDKLFISKYLKTLPQDKETEIITYCGGFYCGLSHHSAQVLIDHGYKNVKVLAGGLPAWKQSGLPFFGLEAGGGSFDITGGRPVRKINPEAFTKYVNEGKAVIIDVRNAAERAGGFIPGSIHIPDSDIHADVQAIAGKLPANKDTTLVIHCASGARASGVVEKIGGLGYPNTFYLDNRIVISSDGKFSF